MNQEFWNCLQLMRKACSQSIEQVGNGFGLTRAEVDVLLFLVNNPTADRATDIVELRGLTKSHVSIAAKDLYDRGFLEAKQDEKDRRVVHLKPTEKAQPVIQQGQEALRQHFAKLFEGFSEAEISQWMALQEKLFANMKTMG